MITYYYLTLFPMEALIASQLDPEVFAAYMAIGPQKGSSERLIFVEVDESAITDSFDIEYAREHCVSYPDGRKKYSVYLSVYRALEATPREALGRLWLVTKDGRPLSLDSAAYSAPESSSGTALYQELCPAHPLVVSTLNPKSFAEYIAEGSGKVSMPAIFFADLTMPSLDEGDYTGNTGGFFDNKLEHLKSCVESLRSGAGKITKVVDRSASARFSFQVVGRGFYIGARGGSLAFYPMPAREELKKRYYDWAKSAQIF